jgi:hypothetical protein
LLRGKAHQLVEGTLIGVPDGGPALSIEVVRLWDVDSAGDEDGRETVSESDEEGEVFWGVPELLHSQRFLIGKLKELASKSVKATVCGAHVHEHGDWKVIASIPEELLFPTEAAEDAKGDDDEDS